jgi:transformation/transcription domain-associated protein
LLYARTPNPAHKHTRTHTRTRTQVADRLRHFAPTQVGEDDLPDSPIHRQAVELAEAAVAPRTLCRMDPTWHPWF